MTDEQILCDIIKRLKSAMWWARLSYLDEAAYWNADESRVLKAVMDGSYQSKLTAR